MWLQQHKQHCKILLQQHCRVVAVSDCSVVVCPPLASGRCSKVSHLRAHMAAATTHVCVCVVASGCAARGGDAVPHCTGLCCSNTHLCVCVCCCCGRLLHLPSISCPQFGGWHAAVVCVLLHHTPSLAPHCVVHVQAALLLTRVCV